MLHDTAYRCANTSRWVVQSQIEFSTSNCPTDLLESNCEKIKVTDPQGFQRRMPGNCDGRATLYDSY